MKFWASAAIAAAFFVLAGCGSTEETADAGSILLEAPPAEGGSCFFNGGRGACEASGTSALICEDAKYRKYLCRGSSGCTSNATIFSCDTSAALEGDACPKASEQTALCPTYDAGLALKCLDGGWSALRCDAGCSVSGGQVFCRQ